MRVSNYEEKVNWALNQKKDVWGEQLMDKAEGPTYDNIKDYLRPLMLCGTEHTESGVYFLAFGLYDGPIDKYALTVADGSQIVSNYYKDGCRKVTFYVGSAGTERYGSVLSRLTEPTLYGGYYPILETEYLDADGVKYKQESFAATIPETTSLVSFIKFTVNKNGTDKTSTKVKIGHSDTEDVSVSGNKLIVWSDVYLLFSGSPSYSSPDLTYTIDISDGNDKYVYLIRLNDPATCSNRTVDEAGHLSGRSNCMNYWDSKLKAGATITVPETRVMNAKKNLLTQNLLMRYHYGLSSGYQAIYIQESGLVSEIYGLYGYTDEYKTGMKMLLHRTYGEGPEAFENWNWGGKLCRAVQYYFLTRDAKFILDNTDTYTAWCADIKAQTENDPNGLLEKQWYTADWSRTFQVYGLHHNTVCWRGIRDMAKIWKLLGKTPLYNTYAPVASGLKTATKRAINSSQTTLADGSLFVPDWLLESKDNGPFDPITRAGDYHWTGKHGNYWNITATYAFASGLWDVTGTEMDNIVKYLHNHGSTLLGLARLNSHALPVGSYKDDASFGTRTPGDNAYAYPYLELIAARDEAERVVLSFYGMLAHGMTRNTFVAGESHTIGPYPGEYYRTFYRPPVSLRNSSFLKLLRLMLIRESYDSNGIPDSLYLAHATPRAWLADGKQIVIKDAPTHFGTLAYTVTSHLNNNYIEVNLTVPSRNTISKLRLKLRVPGGKTTSSVTINGKNHPDLNPREETINLSGKTGTLDIRVNYQG